MRTLLTITLLLTALPYTAQSQANCGASQISWTEDDNACTGTAHELPDRQLAEISSSTEENHGEALIVCTNGEYKILRTYCKRKDANWNEKTACQVAQTLHWRDKNTGYTCQGRIMSSDFNQERVGQDGFSYAIQAIAIDPRGQGSVNAKCINGSWRAYFPTCLKGN